jgi:Cof subfamily protein (haloacid dehalogenase superfamily)
LTSGKYKLLVIDVDGTLINNEANISGATAEALQAAKEAGIVISLSTGRSVKSCQRYVEELSLDNYHVFFDGALVSRPATDENIYIQSLKAQDVKELVEFAREKDINIEITSIDRYFSERETWSTRAKQDYFGVTTTIGDLTGLWEREEIIRADIVVTNREEEAIAAEFIDHFTGRLQFTEAHTPRLPDVTFVNITSPGLSKGKALEALAAHLCIPLESVAAAGDWKNDIPLLTTAGLGIAMGNAHDDLKAVADYVTLDVDDDGLAVAIKKFLL